MRQDPAHGPISPSSRLGPDERQAALDAAQLDELDVVVIGGGVVGAGVALDAVTRGLTRGPVRGARLGRRYVEPVQQADPRRPALPGDARLRPGPGGACASAACSTQRLAPHLVRPVPFLYPLKHRGWERLYAGAGVALYDTMGVSSGNARGLPHHRHLTRRTALRQSPSLRKDALVGAIQYYDAQVDDARHTAAVVRTAAAYGALVANRARVIGFLREGERVTGVRVRDFESDTEFEVRARQVVNATGVWTDLTQAMVGERGQFHVRASKGVHLVVPRDRIQSATGLILRTETSVLFVIPWGRHWIIGTTDTDWDLGKAHPAASRTDIDYLLEHVNRVLVTPLTREDVEGVYAGLRPLLSGESESTSKLSREHTVGPPGARSGRGGRRQVHDVPGDGQGRGRRGEPRSRRQGARLRHRPHPAGRCRGLRRAVERAVSGWPPSTVCTSPGSSTCCTGTARWCTRCWLSSTATRRWAMPSRAPTTTCAPSWCTRPATRVPGISTTCSPGVPGSRSRPSTAASTAAPVAAALMAPVLGWSTAQTEREVEHYLARVKAERLSQEQPDDQTADTARLGAPEIVPLA